MKTSTVNLNVNPGRLAQIEPSMQLFLNLFEPHLQWFYHCFDRLVVNGYLSYFFLESHVVYFILCSMEQGSTFAIRRPKFPTQDSNYRILRKQRSRFLHYY